MRLLVEVGGGHASGLLDGGSGFGGGRLSWRLYVSSVCVFPWRFLERFC